MNKKFLATGAILAGLAVALGAFAAHGLKKIASEESVQIFQTGVHYQMVHALALLIAGGLQEKFAGRLIKFSGSLFISGIILFSGSLYILTYLKANEITGFDKIGMVTPVGGICFIAGWVCLFLAIMGTKKD